MGGTLLLEDLGNHLFVCMFVKQSFSLFDKTNCLFVLTCCCFYKLNSRPMPKVGALSVNFWLLKLVLIVNLTPWEMLET